MVIKTQGLRLELLASPAGQRRFRIEEVSGLVETFRYGDVIEAEPFSDGTWRLQRVVEKGCAQVARRAERDRLISLLRAAEFNAANAQVVHERDGHRAGETTSRYLVEADRHVREHRQVLEQQ
jgi:hypothetical protein